MASENLAKYLVWLTSRFYVFFEVSPTQDTVVELYNIDKFGTPIASTSRIYRGGVLSGALKKAYEQELQKLAESGNVHNI